PEVVEPTPGGHAVDVRANRDARQRQELVPGPRHFFLDKPEAAKRPAPKIDVRRVAVRQHRPLRREHLPGWQALLGSGLRHASPHAARSKRTFAPTGFPPPKTDVPATAIVMPASASSRMFSATTPPSTSISTRSRSRRTSSAWRRATFEIVLWMNF